MILVFLGQADRGLNFVVGRLPDTGDFAALGEMSIERDRQSAQAMGATAGRGPEVLFRFDPDQLFDAHIETFGDAFKGIAALHLVHGEFVRGCSLRDGCGLSFLRSPGWRGGGRE